MTQPRLGERSNLLFVFQMDGKWSCAWPGEVHGPEAFPQGLHLHLVYPCLEFSSQSPLPHLHLKACEAPGPFPPRTPALPAHLASQQLRVTHNPIQALPSLSREAS